MSKLKTHLSNLEKSDLVDLLLKSTHLNKSWTTQLLAYVSDKLSKANPTTNLHSLAKEQYQALASQAFPIIHQHNEYGGGNDDEYELVDDLLTRINKLFAAHQLTHELKREYMDKLFKYYDWGNSGLTDMLMDAIFTVSESVEEWKYVISLLQRKPRYDYSSHYRLAAGYVNHIKTIYIKHLSSPDDWAKYITSLRAAYPRLPALLDELSKL